MAVVKNPVPTPKTNSTKSVKENKPVKVEAPTYERKVSIEELTDTISRETELQEEIQTLRLNLADKVRAVGVLEKALGQQKELTLRHTHEADNEMHLRLQAQKNDYEATIQRHLSFIDQVCGSCWIWIFSNYMACFFFY